MNVFIQFRGPVLYLDLDQDNEFYQLKQQIFNEIMKLLSQYRAKNPFVFVQFKAPTGWALISAEDALSDRELIFSFLFSKTKDAGSPPDTYLLFLRDQSSITELSGMISSKRSFYDPRVRRDIARHGIASVFFRENDCCGYDFFMAPSHTTIACDLLTFWKASNAEVVSSNEHTEISAGKER